jgi:hypothetical protein
VVERLTWRWFTTRLFGLSTDSRTWRKISEQHRADAATEKEPADVESWE